MGHTFATQFWTSPDKKPGKLYMIGLAINAMPLLLPKLPPRRVMNNLQCRTTTRARTRSPLITFSIHISHCFQPGTKWQVHTSVCRRCGPAGLEKNQYAQVLGRGSGGNLPGREAPAAKSFDP